MSYCTALYSGPECSDNLNAPTIVISPSWCVVTVLIFVIFPGTEITSNDKKCDIRNDRARGYYLPENALKLVQKVHPGPVDGFFSLALATILVLSVSSKSFTGFFTLTSVWR
jgi:hypothetical protein